MREISYSQNGEYQIPDISLEETRGTIGKYGMMRKAVSYTHLPGWKILCEGSENSPWLCAGQRAEIC